MRFSMQAMVVVTTAYIGSFIVMNLLISPVQKAVFPELPAVVSLVFLPHGVRILTFYFCGWMGLIYLLPGAFLMWMLMVFGSGLNGYHIAGTAISLLSCFIGVAMARHFFERLWVSSARFSWQQIMVAGVLGSIGNAAGLSLLQFSAPSPMIFSAYVIGDISGLFLVLVFLMGSFRIFDRLTANALR
ncbi:hypothetical protein [Yoonia vestfoldensis]|uniref:Uncharacterized protein n=1 Tax=Yoonia vestfoldensis TaxID=245188 RepID=A0A1Y0EB96_9RHOB|nr:hypothetical protein [Yoonia vestfoldensis]ARU00907.1 hypothetical protein LOKVESSMR4R_01591 [Yoonia vestfoldensis]